MIQTDEQTEMISEWRCGNCGKIYSFYQFIKLNKVKMVESDTDPKEQHGYTPVCECGYRFHLDKWRLYDNVKIKTDKEDIDTIVSTVDLELNHGYEEGENLWYGTMIFPGGFGDDGLEWPKCYYENNYETKEEAIKGHNRIVNLLKEGKYKIEDSNENKKELIIIE